MGVAYGLGDVVSDDLVGLAFKLFMQQLYNGGQVTLRLVTVVSVVWKKISDQTLIPLGGLWCFQDKSSVKIIEMLFDSEIVLGC